MKKTILLLSILAFSLLIVGCTAGDQELEVVDEEGNIVGQASMGGGKMRISPAVMGALVGIQECSEQKSKCNLLSNWEIVTQEDNTNDPRVRCPAGKKVTGGGCSTSDHTRKLVVSGPIAGDDSWDCLYDGYGQGREHTTTAYAICANIN